MKLIDDKRKTEDGREKTKIDLVEGLFKNRMQWWKKTFSVRFLLFCVLDVTYMFRWSIDSRFCVDFLATRVAFRLYRLFICVRFFLVRFSSNPSLSLSLS